MDLAAVQVCPLACIWLPVCLPLPLPLPLLCLRAIGAGTTHAYGHVSCLLPPVQRLVGATIARS
jgi:hypothetical protein